jgi:regulatory protein
VTVEALQRALGVALAYVNRRERTVAEVRQRLERDEHNPSVVADALETLIEQHLLDDERYARLFVQDKRMLEGWGEERIRRALGARGIARDLIDEALAAEDASIAEDTITAEDPSNGGDPSAAAGSSELDRALAVLRRRLPGPPRDRRERDRAFAMLRRRGYSADVAEQALAQFAPGGSRYYDAA